ncbi:MAG: phage tail protein [Synergistaceae bacterium]|jgi:hypothetical protein|nr:phage tail protein [Synergistaceae bacterium]
MISIDISLDEKQLHAVKDTLLHIPGGAEKAIARAINRAVEGARTDAVKAVCELYEIKPVAVRKTIQIQRATPKKLKAIIFSTGSTIGLYNFFVSPKKPPKQKGVKVSNRKTVIAGVKFGTRAEFPGGFIARMKSGHKGIWRRTGETTENGLPEIKEFFGLSVPQMLGNDKVLDFIRHRANRRLHKELYHQINFLFKGGK